MLGDQCLKIQEEDDKMKVVIWSKDSCTYCVQAKEFLKIRGIDYEERNITNGVWTKEHLLDEVPTARSLPQIFIDEELVGGFAELKKRLEG